MYFVMVDVGCVWMVCRLSFCGGCGGTQNLAVQLTPALPVRTQRGQMAAVYRGFRAEDLPEDRGKVLGSVHLLKEQHQD